MIFLKKRYLFTISLTLLFIIFAYLYLDKNIARYFLARASTYEAAGDFISIFGESYWYIGAALIGFLFFGFFKKNELYKQRFLFLLYTNLFSGLLSIILKNIFGRIRPWGLRKGGDEYGFLLFQNFDMGFVEKMKYHFVTLADAPTTYTSFPSGHSTTVFAVFTYLILLFPRYLYLWLGISVILVSGRIMDSDHFLSDITAGALLGTLSTLFLYSKLKEKIFKQADGTA
ncbi:phosphatase PAP2 family protein [Sulfurimonas sp. HSL-1716]|uniref:phosphatase PAP2 family protein n=1 Tax=Hydrocurvibacter sulfurireducens TaxID=3131937 RepID=UPI0031F94038